MVNPFRHFEAEIFDFTSRNYLAYSMISTREGIEPYKIGEEFVVSDSIVHKNNSKRIRKCVIKEIEKISQTKYKVYVQPTKEDVNFKLTSLESIDRDGEDGWLQR